MYIEKRAKYLHKSLKLFFSSFFSFVFLATGFLSVVHQGKHTNINTNTKRWAKRSNSTVGGKEVDWMKEGWLRIRFPSMPNRHKRLLVKKSASLSTYKPPFSLPSNHLPRARSQLPPPLSNRLHNFKWIGKECVHRLSPHWTMKDI